MAVVQAEDLRASLMLGHLNGHRQELLGSTTNNRHGVTAFDSQLCLVVISWFSAQPVRVVGHLTS